MRRPASKVANGGLVAYRKLKAKEIVDQANRRENPLPLRRTDELPILDNVPLTVECCYPKSCSPELLDDMLNVLYNNMKGFYDQSSWEWDTEKKREEAFSSKSRLLICRVADTEFPTSTAVAGFVSFRFEREVDRPVLYCYEIQLREQYRGRSIGCYLMNLLFLIAKDCKMDRVMLTVFKFNERALRFFRALGFVKDETDPSNFKGNPKVDYIIMSKSVM
ncbi:unnamed protein product [Echinostoma caproni]|uniref:N-alpha-acetyltransferase 40 n=1 Tax=Echinostoma caproni TaxID=27848 RepID=A0A183AFJ3_9TREM|nr:unnamed protein product [Echinostoma caproni]